MMAGRAPARRMRTPRTAVLVLVLGAMLFTSVYPMRRYFDFRRTISALHAEGRQLDRTMGALLKQRTLLQTDGEVERLARENLGMVRPGERPFVVLSPSPPPPRTREVSGAAGVAGKPVLSRWWHAFWRAARSRF